MDNLNALLDTLREEVEVECCENGVLVTYTCGKSGPCVNICGENKQSKHRYRTPSSYLSFYSGSSILDIEDVVRGICQAEVSISITAPIHTLWYCPACVPTVEQLDQYAVTCILIFVILAQLLQKKSTLRNPSVLYFF